jgi:hypothetical protein
MFSLFCYGSKLNNKSESKFSLESINFVQNSINVDHSSETLFFSLRAYSQLGLNLVIVYFTSPSGNVTLTTSCVNKRNTTKALLLGRMLFEKRSEIGEWKVSKIIIQDSEGNQQSFDNPFLIQNNFSHSFLVTGN